MRKCACFKHLFLCGPQGFRGIQVEVREMEGRRADNEELAVGGEGQMEKKKKAQECLLVFCKYTLLLEMQGSSIWPVNRETILTDLAMHQHQRTD